MKIVVCYRSFLGTTKKYATWISEELQADLFTFKEVGKQVLDKYDIIFVASGTYAGKMPLVGFLKDHWDTLQKKEVIAIAVGMAPANDPQSRVSYDLIPAKIRKKILYFKLPGKLFKAGPMGEPSKEKLQPVLSAIRHN